ncbi:MAG: DUF2142 domain-containing protein [Actinobacteria bacterium]|nr:DUF2142 domain-containing protein [Actinomycetota bacterium]
MRLRESLPIVLAGISAFFALSAWAFASPPGSAPDDDFHLPAIWCSHGFVEGLCDPEFAGDGYGKTPTPLSPSAICFAFNSENSAACQAKQFDWNNKELAGSRTNEIGRFPNGFYWTMHLLIGDDTLHSAMAMRIFNSFIAVVLLIVTAIYAQPFIRFALIGTWVSVVTPLALFTIPSTNPSSWSIIGLGIYWAALLSFLQSKEKKYLLINGVIITITGLMTINSRSEASPYLLLVTVIILFLQAPIKEIFKLKLKYLLPTTISVLAAYEFLTTPSTLGWSSGLQGGDPNRTRGELWFRNISQWPRLIDGSVGGWPLGWFDTPMPPMTSFFSLLVLIGFFFIGLRVTTWKKNISLILIMGAIFYIPLRILYLGFNFVGEGVQPRYFLPLLMVFIGISLLALGKEPITFSFSQAFVLFGSLVVAHAFALHYTMRRYITGVSSGFTGSDKTDWNLNKDVEWWWSALPNPLTTWAFGSITFALAAFIAINYLRKPIKLSQ